MKLAGQFGNGLRNTVLVLLLIAAIVAAIVVLSRKKAIGSAASLDLTAPADPTPFSTVAFLRRIRATHDLVMSDSEKAALNKQIAEIEAACFSREPVKNMDFPGLIKKWLEVARRPVGPA